MAKYPTLADALDRWPIFETIVFDGMDEGQIDRMFQWAIGEDWRSVKIDFVPSRIMKRLNLAIAMDDDPMHTFMAIRDEWNQHLLDEAVKVVQ